jgi:hypothetical protein
VGDPDWIRLNQACRVCDLEGWPITYKPNGPDRQANQATASIEGIITSSNPSKKSCIACSIATMGSLTALVHYTTITRKSLVVTIYPFSQFITVQCREW